MTEPKFAVDDPVQKIRGYRFPGIIRSVYRNGAGDIRYDVEADHPDFRGMLHIFSEAQLIHREPQAPDPRRLADEIRAEIAQQEGRYVALSSCGSDYARYGQRSAIAALQWVLNKMTGETTK